MRDVVYCISGSMVTGLVSHLRDGVWLVCLYGDNQRALARGLSTAQAHEACSISLAA